MENVPFIFWKKLNGPFDQPNIYFHCPECGGGCIETQDQSKRGHFAITRGKSKRIGHANLQP